MPSPPPHREEPAAILDAALLPADAGPDGASASRLCELHRALHEALLARLEAAMVSLVAMDPAAALVSWRVVTGVVAAHRHHEEAALASLLPEPALPRGAGQALVVAEHDRLETLLERAEAIIIGLARIATSPDLERHLALVRALDDLQRPRHLLEHHTLREDSLVYPHLARHLAPRDRDELAGHIEALSTTLRGGDRTVP